MKRFKFNTVGLFTRNNKDIVDFYTRYFGFTTEWDGIQPNVEIAIIYGFNPELRPTWGRKLAGCHSSLRKRA